MALVGNASALLSKERRSLVLKKINSEGTLASLAAEEFPDAKKNLFGDGFEERLKTRSETAKTLFQAANVGENTMFFSRQHHLFQEQRVSKGRCISRCSTKPVQQRFPPLPRILGQGLPTQCHPEPPTVKQVSVHLAQNISGLNLDLKQLNITHLPQVGRVKHCLVNWQIICKDPWILQAIQGYQIDFTSPPCQTKPPQGIIHTQEESSLIENEVQELLTKEAIHSVPVHQRQEGFVSNLFLVPKKGGGQRPVKNLNHLNHFVKYEHFKMENIHMLRDLLKKRRLSGKNRFEGCVCHNPHLGKPPKISEVSLEGESLRVCLPSIWTSFRPTSLHQNHETGNRAFALVRDSSYNLSRRHADHGQDSRVGQLSCSYNSEPPRKLGVHYKFPEINSNTMYHQQQ